MPSFGQFLSRDPPRLRELLRGAGGVDQPAQTLLEHVRELRAADAAVHPAGALEVSAGDLGVGALDVVARALAGRAIAELARPLEQDLGAGEVARDDARATAVVHVRELAARGPVLAVARLLEQRERLLGILRERVEPAEVRRDHGIDALGALHAAAVLGIEHRVLHGGARELDVGRGDGGAKPGQDDEETDHEPSMTQRKPIELSLCAASNDARR